MSVVGPVSEAPACTALHLSSSEGSVPHGRGGGGVWVTQLGISPAHRAILQPLGRAGAGSRGRVGFSRGLNLPPFSPQKAPGCTSASEIFPEGGSTSSEQPSPRSS